MRKVITSRQRLNVIGISGRVMERGDFVHHGNKGGGFGDIGGWSDGLDCGGGGTIAIRNNTEEHGDLQWTDATGVTFTKNGTVQSTGVTINVASTSPSAEVLFDVTWADPISQFDAIEMHYDHTIGNFANDDGPLGSATHAITNCDYVGEINFKVLATTLDLVASNSVTVTGAPFSVDWGDGAYVDYIAGATASAVATGPIEVVSTTPIHMQFNTDTFTSIDWRNTASLNSLALTFFGLTNLTEILAGQDVVNNIIDYTSALEGCTGLTGLGVINTTTGQVFDRMFFGCSAMTCLGKIDTTSQTSTTDMFTGCTALTAPDATEQTALLAGSSYINPGECPEAGWKLENTVFDEYISISSPTSSAYSVVISDDGTKMFMLTSTGDRVNEWTLSTPFMISSAVYANKFYAFTEDTSPYGMSVSPDGKTMFMSGTNTDTVYQYTLGTAWDLDTIGYASKSKLISAQTGNAYGIDVSRDGTKMYALDFSAKVGFQYNLGTAWDVSTAVYANKSADISSTGSEPMGVVFDGGGTKMFITDAPSSTVYQYDVATAWDISTATYSGIFYTIGDEQIGATSPRCTTFSVDGAKMYIVENGNNNMYQYSTE